jgi:hypothetical protein
MLALLMLLSQRRDPRRNKSHNLIKMCECVFFVYELSFLCMTLSFAFDIWDVGYLSLLSFFSWTCICPNHAFEHAFISFLFPLFASPTLFSLFLLRQLERMVFI